MSSMMNISPQNTERIVTVQISERVRVHALRSGWVQVRSPHCKYSGIEAFRFPSILLSSSWAEKMSVWMWLALFANARDSFPKN
ncbi:MAG: hypothetical protein EAZ92_00960 [Candidatus Kapaibacterium sp.]|nr:MAG: hypothetical protein EAZ92_00960 [Candidatus Kapabacteria bacterium]